MVQSAALLRCILAALPWLNLMTDFKYPPIYEFPPFFTKQVNEAVWQTQLGHWDRLILDYSRFHHISKLGTGHELFTNPRIQRSVKPEVARLILQYMVTQGDAEWSVKNQSVLVYTQKPAELAEALRSWVVDTTGQAGSVLTLYELTQNETGPMYLIDEKIVSQALDILVHRGQASLMKGPGGQVMGVKVT